MEENSDSFIILGGDGLVQSCPPVHVDELVDINGLALGAENFGQFVVVAIINILDEFVLDGFPLLPIVLPGGSLPGDWQHLYILMDGIGVHTGVHSTVEVTDEYTALPIFEFFHHTSEWNRGDILLFVCLYVHIVIFIADRNTHHFILLPSTLELSNICPIFIMFYLMIKSFMIR